MLSSTAAFGQEQTFIIDEGAMRKPLVTVDLSEIASIDHLHEVLYEALEFPGWYGRNWDAFWDSITGLVEMPEHLQLIGWGLFAERFPRDACIMKKCFDDMSNELPTLAALWPSPIDTDTSVRRILDFQTVPG